MISGAPSAISGAAAADVEPTWSPDGNFIAFTYTRHGDSDIYLMRADGSQLTRLTDSPAHDMSPDWAVGE